jgi:hypothetical protein
MDGNDRKKVAALIATAVAAAFAFVAAPLQADAKPHHHHHHRRVSKDKISPRVRQIVRSKAHE